MKSVDCWWFSANKSLPHDDGRRIEIGATHKVWDKIVPCHNGLHGSKRAIDALQYAPGPIVWKVRLSGVIVPHGDPADKFAGGERTYLAGGVDATDVLRKFARLCALDVLHLWDAADVVKRFLATGDESLRDAAGAAAWDAWATGTARDDVLAAYAAVWTTRTAEAAAESAAGAASRAAASAAESAAGAASRAAASAAWDATRAARDAAREAARAAQNRRLTRMLNVLIREGK